MPPYRLLVLAGVLCVITSISASAQVPAEEDAYYYGWKGAHVPLYLSTERVGITFADPVTAQDIVDFCAGDSHFLHPLTSTYPAVANLGRFIVIRLAHGPGKARVEDLISTLADRPDITSVNPVYRMGTAHESLLTDYIHVLVEATEKESQFLAKCAADNLSVLRRYPYPQLGKTVFRLGVTAQTRATTSENCLAIANRYHEDPVTLEAAPVFAPLYDVQTTLPAPDDPFFAGRPNRGAKNWYFTDTNMLQAWEAVYGDDWSNVDTASEIVIAFLDNGVTLDYSDRTTGDAGYDLSIDAINGTDYITAEEFPPDVEGHPDLNAVQWMNWAEVNGRPNIDDDNNGAIDDYFGWDFVGPHPAVPIVNIDDDLNRHLDGDRIPFPDVHSLDARRQHGTLTASVAVAQTNNAVGVAGICPSCTLMPVRYHVFSVDQGDIFSQADVFWVGRLGEAINYASGHNSIDGADVSTRAHVMLIMAFFESYDPHVRTAVQQARANGVVMVAPSGNTSLFLDATPWFPTVWPEVISVGMSTPEDVSGTSKRGVSNWGSTLDVVAPSSAPGIMGATWDDTGYVYKKAGGTSMSSPQVAGLAGLMLTVSPDLSPVDIQFIIQDTAQRITGLPFDPQVGYGRIDALAAVLRAGKWHEVANIDHEVNPYAKILRVGITKDDAFDFWGENAIQEAIDSIQPDPKAISDGVIIAAPGTYLPIDTMGRRVVIRSSNPYDRAVVESTIIRSSSGRAVIFSGFDTPPAYVVGLIGLTISGEGPGSGGIDGGGTKASIFNCRFINNDAPFGGAIENCDGNIQGNIFGGHPLEGNTASVDGGALYGCNGEIRRNLFLYNQAGNTGGAMSRCNFKIAQNFIGRNKAIYGAALAECDASIESNIIFENVATTSGAGMWECDGPSIGHNTLYKNDAYNGTGGVENCDVKNFVNNIIWGNTGGDDLQIINSPGIRFSCVGQLSIDRFGRDNIGPWQGSKPLVDDAAGGPRFIHTSFTGSNFAHFLHLASDSPCIDRGEGTQTYRDFDNQAGPLDGDTSMPEIKHDMGADEVPTPPRETFSFWWENL